MSFGLAVYSYSRVLVCEIYSTQLILIMTSLAHIGHAAVVLCEVVCALPCGAEPAEVSIMAAGHQERQRWAEKLEALKALLAARCPGVSFLDSA